MLVDVHAHLSFEDFDKDRDEVVARAKKAGLGAVIDVGTNPKGSKQTLEFSKKHDIVKASVGIYPEYADDFSDKEIEEFFNWIRENRKDIIALGEVGLDFHTDEAIAMKDKQIKLLKKIIDLSDELNLPLIIHSRKGEREVVELLESYCPHDNIMLHFFNGRKNLIQKAIDNGWYISIITNIERNTSLQSMAKMVPMNRILTETDSPWVGPIAGERNEPKNVKVTIKKIAEIKGLSEKEVEDQIWQNFNDLFF